MRIVRYLNETGDASWGILDNTKVLPLKTGPYEKLLQKNDCELELSSVKLLAPCNPSKIVCVGLNYHDHAEEMSLPLPKEPLLFLKPPSSIIGPDETILYPPQTSNLHYEAELAIVIGAKTKDASPAQAGSAILGYTCANDVTARDLQFSDGQWTRGKSFDTFLPIGPWLETKLDPSNLDISLRLNGALRQKSNTERLIFSPSMLVSYISQIMTLDPGDLILTGTPAGVGAMEDGDCVEVCIAGVGTLKNTVTKQNFATIQEKEGD